MLIHDDIPSPINTCSNLWQATSISPHAALLSLDSNVIARL